MKRLSVKPCSKIIIIFIITFYFEGFGQIVDSVSYPPNSFNLVPAINFKDTDLRDLLRGIALENKTNIVVDNRINKRVSVALFDLTVFNTIKIITEDNGFDFAHDNKRFFVKIKTEVKEKPMPVPKPKINFYADKNTVDMYLQNVDINEFATALRIETRKNFLLTQGTSGKINGTLMDIQFETGIRNILQNNGYTLLEKDSIFYISRNSYFSTIGSPDEKTKGHYWVSAQDGRITVDVKEVSLDKILDDITNQLNLSIIKLDSPDEQITVKCTNVPLDQTLNYLFKGTNFTFKKENNTYVVGNQGTHLLDNMRMLKLKHLRADKVKDALPATVFEGVQMDISMEHNAIMAIGPNQTITILEEYIKKIDHPVPQVMIEALVVDYNLDHLYQFGITAAVGDTTMANRPDRYYPGIDVTASGAKVNKILKDIGHVNLFGKDINVGSLGQLPDDFYVNIQALEHDGIANIQSRPILSTLNGNTALLKIGTIQNYVFKDIMPVQNQMSSSYIEKERIQQIEATISFEITPWVGPNDQLTLELKPEFQTPKGEFSPDKNLIPSINTRMLESTVKLKDGETIVVGGLVQEIESNSYDKFPILGDIPWIGELFKNKREQKTKTELMIYITPRIFYGDEFGYAHFEYGDEE